LHVALELQNSRTFDECKGQVLGTRVSAMNQAADRGPLRELMRELNEPHQDADIVDADQGAWERAEGSGHPMIVRPARTMGGTGGGIAHNGEELKDIASFGLKYSPVTQCMIEKSIAGFKEIEYEVMRDKNDNALVVCNMENIDPVGVHTGDSIVVAPS